MSVANTSSARCESATFSSSVCSESAMSSSTRARASPPCSTSASTIEWVTRMRGVSFSGTDSTRRLKVSSFQLTKFSGGFFFLILRSFFASPAAFTSALWFSISCSGASAMTTPSVSKPDRPARPAIWWNSRERRRRILWPSNFVSAVSTTVWMGTLMPTPSVSVPQMTGRTPCWASFSTSRR